jgi:hypothetical protein
MALPTLLWLTLRAASRLRRDCDCPTYDSRMPGAESVEILAIGRCRGWQERVEYRSAGGNATLRRLSVTEIGMGGTVWGYWDVVGPDSEPLLDSDSLSLSVGDASCFQPWSPTGDRFVLPILDRLPDGTWQYGVTVVGLREHEVVAHFEELFASSLIWAPNGDDVLALTNDGPLLLDSRSGQRRGTKVLGFDRAKPSCAAWLPSGAGFGCSVGRHGSQRLVVLDCRTLRRIGQSALDPSSVVPFNGKDGILEIDRSEMIFWQCENYFEGGFGLVTTPRDALKLVFGEWANVAVESDSATLQTSVYRPRLASNGKLTLSSGSDGYRTCDIEEVRLRVPLSD